MNFHDFAAQRGLIIKHVISGRWVRVPTVDHPNSKNGAYLFQEDFAVVQNWAIQEQAEVWHSGKVTTQEAKKRFIDAKKSVIDDIQSKNKAASSKAKWILSQCELDKHAYLDSKGFPDLLGNVWRKEGQDPLLIIPMHYKKSVVGVQIIGIDGSKKFLSGQKTSLAHFKIGNGSNIFLVEGYATGLSLQAALKQIKIDYTIYVCFSAGNLAKLAKFLPKSVIICDNDKSGTGENVARESGLKYWLSDRVGDDFNDYHRRVGLFICSMGLKKFLYCVK